MSDRRGVPISKAEVESMLQGAIRGIGQALTERLRALESGGATKALDVAAYDAMTELAERLDRMDRQITDMVEHGIRYRGYWSHGTKAARGDSFTHDGSVWRCNRETIDEPGRDSPDWSVLVRKGADAVQKGGRNG